MNTGHPRDVDPSITGRPTRNGQSTRPDGQHSRTLGNPVDMPAAVPTTGAAATRTALARRAVHALARPGSRALYAAPRCSASQTAVDSRAPELQRPAAVRRSTPPCPRGFPRHSRPAPRRTPPGPARHGRPRPGRSTWGPGRCRPARSRSAARATRPLYEPNGRSASSSPCTTAAVTSAGAELPATISCGEPVQPRGHLVGVRQRQLRPSGSSTGSPASRGRPTVVVAMRRRPRPDAAGPAPAAATAAR